MFQGFYYSNKRKNEEKSTILKLQQCSDKKMICYNKSIICFVVIILNNLNHVNFLSGDNYKLSFIVEIFKLAKISQKSIYGFTIGSLTYLNLINS